MPLVEVRRAIYAYEPTDDDELAIKEGDVLYILSNNDPDWLQAKRKPVDADGAEEQGLVPANHTEIIKPISQARALYDYEPTQDEETTLVEDEHIQIIESDDPDWFMARTNGGYGFIPKAYVELISTKEPPAQQMRKEEARTDEAPARTPEPAALAPFVAEGKKKKGGKVTLGISNAALIIDSNSDTVAPKRYAMAQVSKCTAKKAVLGIEIGGYEPAAFDFTCGSAAEAERILDAINAARRGMFIGDRVVGDKSGDDMSSPLPSRENQSFLATSPQPAPQVTATSPVKMPVLPPHTTMSQEHAVVLYEFSSDDPEELTVSEGDRVLVLDKSDPEWWQVQLSPPHGRAGLVPASYVELQPVSLNGGLDSEYELPAAPPANEVRTLQLPTHTDTVRQVESRSLMATPAQPAPPTPAVTYTAPSQIERSVTTPPSSRRAPSDSDNMPLHLLQLRQSQKAEPLAAAPPPIAEGPDMSKVRTWTDGSGAYTVEAQFLRLDPDGQVHLHKTNNKKITVDLAKFSSADRQYVESVTGSSIPPAMPAKPMTARQRQQESARKNPERRPINYDWDWFDYFTLKCGVSADNALKYATSFVAERLDDESIPEITIETLRTLGVKPIDIPKIQHAFRVHQGLPVDNIDSMTIERSLSPSQLQPQELKPVLGSPSWAQQSARSPGASSPKAPPESVGRPQPRRAANNPWGIDSELDRRSDRMKQIDSDEALARRMQEEEKLGKKRPNARKQNVPRGPASDPFTSLDVPVTSLSSSLSHCPAGPHPAATSKPPLNLAAGSRKPARTQASVVDPVQLRSAQQKLSGPASLSPTIPDAGSSGRNALDEAFGTGRASKSPPPQQQQQQEQLLPPRSRPTVSRNQSAITANMAPLIAAPSTSTPSQPQASMQGMGELTTQRMAIAAATGNTAQIDRLEQLAKAKAQELAVQEARIKQQQEEIRQQAMFLQQQQQQLLQMQQTQKVEAQLKQLKEDKERLERLETQRQAEAMKQQVEMLKSQQEQMLRMQQMASQARALQATANSSVAQAPTAAPVSMSVPIQQQQQQQPLQQTSMLGVNTSSIAGAGGQLQQKPVPLSSRLPPPLIPSQMSKPMALQPSQAGLQQQQQANSFAQRQQQFGAPNSASPVGMFSAAHGITNLPAASSSTTGLTPAGMTGSIFANHAVTGSTPNLGSFTSTSHTMPNAGGFVGGFAAAGGGGGGGGTLAAGYNTNNGNVAATHSVTNFASFNSNQVNQPGSQFMTQQQRQLHPNSTLAIGSGNINSAPMNQSGSKYDLFKSINPHAPSVFSGNIQQQQQMPVSMNAQYSSSSIVTSSGFNNLNSNPLQQLGGIGQRPIGPTGVFAMANPTLGNQQQQQQNMRQAQMLNQQQHQPQHQQMFNANQAAAGFGSQMQWH
ncbi:cytoskeletal protein binding protein [Coemansia sp. BCRC 34962]|nr:cytoskeletal protein binding protein [Coemansia sp. BCRC 34962]